MKMNLGVAGPIVPSDPSAITPACANDLAYLGVQTVAIALDGPPTAVSRSEANRVRQVLDAAGISIAQSTGYNPRMVDPDADVRARELQRLTDAFGLATELGARAVLTGASSLHPTAFYGPHPDNRSPATRERLVESLRTAADIASRHELPLLIECHVLTPMFAPTAIAEVLNAVGSPWVRANFDPVNMLGDVDSAYNNGDRMRHMWKVLGDHYAQSAHIKDIAVGPDLVLHLSEVPPGEGLMDYEAYFEVVRENMADDAVLIIEHMSAEETRHRIDHVRKLAITHGISFGP